MADSSLALSDAEFMEQAPPADEVEEAPAEAGEVVDIEKEAAAEEITSSDNLEIESEDEEALAAQAAEDSEAQEDPDAVAGEGELGQPEGDTSKEHETSDDSDDTESLDTSEKDSPDTKADKPDTTEFDYESAYKKVSEPFKANGVDMQVKDPQDIVRLMQMGANYQKKMASLKPNLKIISTLEKNGLLDEDKLNQLIDISNKDPKAIAKLVKESGLDPEDIDEDASNDYRPNDHSVSDKEFNLDQVLDGIKDTETFSKTINVLTKEWDGDSKAAISDNPEIISIINEHMLNGVYDKVNTVMQQEKTLGKLTGVSDVDAYRQIAEQLHKSGILKEDTSDSKEGSSGDTSNVSSETEQAKAERDKARKAVAPVKQTTTQKAKPDGDFLGLSDDEFMKKYG